jgi:hypothetical protein
MAPAARLMAVIMSEKYQPHYSCLHTENCDGTSSLADGSFNVWKRPTTLLMSSHRELRWHQQPGWWSLYFLRLKKTNHTTYVFTQRIAMALAARLMAVIMSEKYQPHYSCLHTENCDDTGSQADGSFNVWRTPTSLLMSSHRELRWQQQPGWWQWRGR